MKTKHFIVTFTVIFIAIFYFILLSKQPMQNDTTNGRQNVQQIDDTASKDFTELNITVIEEGNGREVKDGDSITVDYIGTLPDGSKFDSSFDHDSHFSFTVGEHQVIEGWEKGVLGMKVGEKRKLEIPSAMAYGPDGYPPVIPAKTGLIFEITLISID
jgi:FKBP-type peptidyl-prolyl cis-trans isomerase